MKLEMISYDDLKKLKVHPSFKDIGQFVEQCAIDIFSDFVPPAFLYPNPIIGNDRGEMIEITDILFGTQSTLLIIECKGREIGTVEDAKNYEKLDRWLSKRLSKATKQLRRAENFIKENNSLVGKLKDFTVICDFSQVVQIIPIIVIFEIPDFFWREAISKRKQKYPQIQIIDLKGIYLLSKFLLDVDDLLYYLEQKQRLYLQHQDFIAYEENLLIYYLSNGKNFGSLLKLKSVTELNSEFASGLPWSITAHHLYDTSAENINRLHVIFQAISKLGIEAWEKLVEENGSHIVTG